MSKVQLLLALKLRLLERDVCVCLFPINNKDNPIALFGPGGHKTKSNNILKYLILIQIKTYIVYMCGKKKSKQLIKGK